MQIAHRPEQVHAVVLEERRRPRRVAIVEFARSVVGHRPERPSRVGIEAPEYVLAVFVITVTDDDVVVGGCDATQP